MECCGSTSEDQKCCNFFLLEDSGDSHQFDDSKNIHQEKCQDNCEHHGVEDDAESSNYETKDDLGNSQEVISGFEEDNYDEEDDGHKCSIKKEVCKDIVEEKEEEEEEEEDVSSSRAINMEDEVERNRLFWQTCFEVGYP
ncbi:hypothetical protein KY290_001594 [Solanum tuberosum]|uniref:Uncharacterized protein n=1 Tax=Solanum tuberosum TaxID=4113 RepID=A0ABQ7WP24_SOLTU|nr:hypothetical protein KY290_001594 [Solanum tuberosum]